MPSVVESPSGLLYRLIQEALTQVHTDDAWLTSQDGSSKFYQSHESPYTVHYLPFVSDDQTLEATGVTLEERFQTMRPSLVMDMLDIAYWHWLTNKCPPDGVGLTMKQVLTYRGMKVETKPQLSHWQAILDCGSLSIRHKQEFGFKRPIIRYRLPGATSDFKFLTFYSPPDLGQTFDIVATYPFSRTLDDPVVRNPGIGAFYSSSRPCCMNALSKR
jgi:hypothetical protein